MYSYMVMTLEKNRAEFWGSNRAESPEREKPQGFSVSRGKTYWSTIDANGNETSSQQYKYSWDAKNHLVGISWINPQPPTMTDNITFTYDGNDHCVGIVENHGSTVLTSKTFVWCGDRLCQERDSTGHTVTKQFFDLGEQINGTNYYFAKDHLRSIREVVDGSGNVQASYDYDPYGRQAVLSQAVTADFGYAGMYANKSSGLNLTVFRVYDPDEGRWLSRDPIQEQDGLNLYAYVKDNPINRIDPLGLYGTTDCSYYEQKCKQTGSFYYCHVAPTVCKHTPNSPWANCVRECLQELDAQDPIVSNGSFSVSKFTSQHAFCFSKCHQNPNCDPTTKGGCSCGK